MVDKINTDNINPEIISDVCDDLFKIFGSSQDSLDKNQCRSVLNIVFEALFDEKLKTKNFNYIFDLISINNNKITRDELEPVIKSFIVCFNVNYITNSNSFNDKVCIKIGKHLLPTSYYIKKNNE